MIYPVLFFGSAFVGVLFYFTVRNLMLTAGIDSPPKKPLFFIFGAYGIILLFLVSSMCQMWSGMHSIALFGSLLIGIPWMLLQGFLLRNTWSISSYHRAIIILSYAFPAALIGSILLSVLFSWQLP